MKSRALADAANPYNTFVRRGLGGPVSAGAPYVVGDRGPQQYWEVFVPDSPGHVFPSVGAYEESHDRMMARLRARAASSSPSIGAAPQNSQAKSGVPPALVAASIGSNKMVADAVNELVSKLR